MKLHLPVRLFKSVLTCLSAVASFSLGSGVAWAEAQNLTFSGSSLTWDTSAENKSFVDEEDAAASFAAGDNVSFTGESAVTLGENITVGTLDIATGADVTIDLEEYTLHTDTISLSGTLAVGNSLSIASGSTLAVKNAAAVLDSALVLGEKSGLVVESAASLNSHTLTLQGGSNLILTAAGDGKTYTLFTGISSLVDKNGNTLTAGSYSINVYFDKTAPGSGFWADATLVLTVDGTLQLVRHNEIVKDSLDVTTRQTSNLEYNYYEGISFKDIVYSTTSSSAYGGAIYGDNIELNNNGSVTFQGNTVSDPSDYATAYGGAIYGTNSITLNHNGHVCIENNVVEDSYEANGGAICGDDYSFRANLSNNQSVTVCENQAYTSGNPGNANSRGGAIYSNMNGTIKLTKNGTVLFGENIVSSQASVFGNAIGGAIFGGCIIIDENGVVEFKENKAQGTGEVQALGGAIVKERPGSLSLSKNTSVLFEKNAAISDIVARGGAIWAVSAVLDNNGSVTFSGNTASSTSSEASGGAIYGFSDSTITLSNNGSVVFEGNTASSADSYGGAIYGGGDITLCNNGSVVFVGNTASGSSSARGGAICGGTITLNNNGSVKFIGNMASTSSTITPMGGAIWGSIITLNNNGSVEFSGNSAYRSGAIFGYEDGTITLNNNGSVCFSGNTASSYAGAVGGELCNVTLSNNASVSFIENKAAVGGAIFGLNIELNNNGSVLFSGNSASWTSYGGGAICTYYYNSPITLSDNGSVTFSGNYSSFDGGAIYGSISTTITLSDNGSVMFSGNSSSSAGGAIYGDDIELNNNGSVAFSGNTASSNGGAIYTSGSLHIRNNDSVEFAGNVEKEGSAYRLRSVYVYGVSDDVLNISAAAGKTVSFHDSIYVGSDATVNLNADYEDAEGNIIEQKGDIVFTGATTVTDLYKAKGNVDGTEEEIRLSRTSEVLSMANLYNGRLIIKDGAIWSGAGITVDPVAGATGKPTILLQNGILTHDASSVTNRNVVTIKSGGAFEVSGKSQADYTSLNMESGSILTFNIAPENATTAALTLDSNSSLTQEGALTLQLKGDNRLVKGLSYKLLTGLAQPDTWDETSVTVESGSLGWDVDYADLTWEGDTLWIYYNGNILPPVEFRPNLDRNQQAVYDTVKDIMGAGNPGGVLGLLGQEVAGSRDEAALKRVLDELSGREYATIMSSQMEGNMGHLRRLRAAAGTGTPLGEYVSVSYCYPSNKGVDKSDNKGASVQIALSPVVDSRRLRAGISVFHEEGELDSDNNGDGYDRSETGAQLTMEYMVSNEFIMGMGISQSRTRLTPDYGKRRHEDNTHFDLYGVYQSGRWSTTTALGLGLHQHDLGRTVAGMQTEAEADGFSVNFLQEVAYTVWADEQQGVQVYGAVESSFNQVDSFTETGAGNASLTMDSQEAWATDVTLGLRYNHALPALDKALPGTLSLHAGVVASLGDVEETSTMRFAGAPGYSFRQGASERNRWGYSVGVSVNLPVSANVAAFGSAEAVLRGDSYTADAQLGLKVAF